MASTHCEYPGCTNSAAVRLEDFGGETVVTLCDQHIPHWIADVTTALITVMRGKERQYHAPMLTVQAIREGE